MICEDKPLHPILAAAASTLALITGVTFIYAIVMHAQSALQSILATLTASLLIAQTVLICSAPGPATPACLLALVYPLAGLAAAAKTRGYRRARDLCKTLAVTSVLVSPLIPITVYYCLAPPLGTPVEEGRDKSGVEV